MSRQRIKARLIATAAGALLLVSWAPVPAAASAHKTTARALETAPNAILRKEVFGFANDYNLGDPAVGYQSWNFSLLSTVAYFALHVNPTDGGLIGNDTGWYTFHSSTMVAFVATAHANGTKVIVSINLHDYSTDPSNRTCTGLVPSVSSNTVYETVSEVQKAGIDGVNINYEGTLTNCFNGATNRSELVTFVQNMRAQLPKGAYLSIDTFSGAAEDNQEFFDLTSLAPYVDSFFVMAYDMDYANYSTPPLNCTSFCFNPQSPLNTYGFNVTKSAQEYSALVPASKVIMGQPYYGRRGCVPNLTDAFQYPVSGKNFVTTTYLYASTIPSQTGVSNFKAHRDPFDGVSEWDTWYDSDWQCNREQYFDDVYSLAAKYDVINRYNLRGVGLFTLDYGGGATELWQLLANKFATTTPWYSLGGYLTSTAVGTSWGASRTDVFARGTDNALWHRSWDGAAWSAWESLGGIVTANPAAVSWGPNRLDIFVRGTDNGIWHRSWDGVTWSPWDAVGGIATSAPAAASWGTNRLDVVVRGTNNGLWHRSWDGTRWGGWDAIGGVATSDPAVVASGTGRLDVVVTGTNRGLWHRSGDGAGNWGAWDSLGGIIVNNPAIASCSPGHLDVFVQGTNLGLWQNSFNGTTWTGWNNLRGYWSAGPGAACTPATTNVNLFERGPEWGLWQTVTPGT
jgi:spore germination protein YaaH